jgi:LmbE family N-acetylglucosaminyl deacetylase
VCIIPQESRDGDVIQGAKKRRLSYQEDAAQRLSCQIEVLDMDPYEFKFDRKLVKIIDKAIVEFKPDIIFTHWDHDTHQDHKAVAEATFAAARKNNISVLMYEQLTLGGISPDSFKSHIYVDITETIEDKIKSIKAYKFLSDSDIEAVYSLSRFRGNQIGVKYAECFEVCKVIANIGNECFSMGKISEKGTKKQE